MISIQPDTKAAYRLMHDGILALAEIERTGMRIDADYCRRQIDILDRRVERLIKALHKTEDILEWKQIYKQKFNLESPRQLADYLYKHKRLIPMKVTEKGNASVDDESLKTIKEPFVQDLLRIRRLKKTRDTYLKGILSEVSEDGLLHPFFNLHTVKTFRSSAQSPNFQNLPIRDKEMGKIIRQAFIPRQGYRFGGVDYAAIEVKIAACYHHDQTMLEYIRNPSSDMHRDMAMECYKLRQDQVTKISRYCAKNKFVFPQFYGDWYKNCAVSLWSAIDEMELQTADGVPMREHLRTQNIKNYNRFEDHIQRVENRFWNDRFSVYAEWKRQWIKEYERNGYFHTLTGFTCSGVMGRNDVVNYPVQGSAFHCLLWSLIRLHDWLKQEKLQTKIVGQIHDEITLDVFEEEMDVVLSRAKEIMCEEIRREWPWIVVPLDVESSFAPVDQSWHEKEVV
jgi:DNA polymerase-1